MHHGRFLCHVHVRALYWFRQDRSLDRMPVAGSWQYAGLWKLVRALRACGGSGVGGIRGVGVDVVGGGVVSAQTGGMLSIDDNHINNNSNYTSSSGNAMLFFSFSVHGYNRDVCLLFALLCFACFSGI